MIDLPMSGGWDISVRTVGIVGERAAPGGGSDGMDAQRPAEPKYAAVKWKRKR